MGEKRENDLKDIKFCIEKLYEDETFTMPDELKELYTEKDWEEVAEALKNEVDGDNWNALAADLGIAHTSVA